MLPDRAFALTRSTAADTTVLNLGLQLAAIRHHYPVSTGRIRRGRLTCMVPLQPTVASRRYTVGLAYQHGQHPKVDVVEPKLEMRADAARLPHVYPGDHLCLYYGKEWHGDLLLAHTLLPWASEWLLHYELWLATGTWHGGGTTH